MSINKKHKGASIAQYAIIIAIVSIGAIPLFYLIGKNIVESFQGFQKGLAAQEEFISSDDNNKAINDKKVLKNYLPEVPAGSLGGTPDVPVSKCEDTNCVIDFGDYVLTGIPENFNEVIEASGMSGGSDKLIALMYQIAAQLEESGDLEGAEDYKKLANLSHLLARYQENNEKKAKNCSSEKDPIACFKSNSDINYNFNVSLDEEMKELLPAYSSLNSTYFKEEASRIDKARRTFFNNPENFERDKTKYPSYAAVALYEKINNDPKYSDSMKNVTKELFKGVGDMAVDQYKLIKAVESKDEPETIIREDGRKMVNTKKHFSEYDFDTGAGSGSSTSDIYVNTFSDVYRPRHSRKSDMKSSLICVSGWNKDSGKKCH